MGRRPDFGQLDHSRRKARISIEEVRLIRTLREHGRDRANGDARAFEHGLATHHAPDPANHGFGLIEIANARVQLLSSLGAGRSALVVGDLVVRDSDWDEADRLTQWKRVLAEVADLPPTLAAALIWEAWESLEPMQRQHWLGGQFVSAYLRARGKVASHLFGFNVGLKAVPRERRRSASRLTRILAFLDAMSASAESGMKEIARLGQAREQMARRLNGRRSSSSLPTAIELVLTRPIVSAPMVAKAAKITQRGALNLIGELGVRELTGRGRYRAWGIL